MRICHQIVKAEIAGIKQVMITTRS